MVEPYRVGPPQPHSASMGPGGGIPNVPPPTTKGDFRAQSFFIGLPGPPGPPRGRGTRWGQWGQIWEGGEGAHIWGGAPCSVPPPPTALFAEVCLSPQVGNVTPPPKSPPPGCHCPIVTPPLLPPPPPMFPTPQYHSPIVTPPPLASPPPISVLLSPPPLVFPPPNVPPALLSPPP